MKEKLLNYFNGDELAANVWLSKYAQEGEETPDDMHKRMAKEFARIEENFIKFSGEGVKPSKIENQEIHYILSKYGNNRAHLTEESIYNLFKDFKYIIPQGSIMSTLGTDTVASLSNCFVIGQPEDSYGGIFQKDEEMAQLMKRRGGVGLDISTLRPEGTSTSNAAKTTTGAVSFMHRFSNTTREVAQNGRRGALMLSMDINHPDIMEFIKIKRDLSQVTGANISIKLNDEFMKAVENDEDYTLRFPCDLDVSKISYLDNYPYNELDTYETNDGKQEGYIKRIKAREYWDEIIKSAHNVAEPGIIFEDNHHDYSPESVYPEYKGVTTNPCFRGDMKLLTAGGYKTFSSLENKEIDLINKNGDIVKGTVWKSGVKEVFEILTWNNTKIYSTKDHVYLTSTDEEVKAENLKGKRLKSYYTLNKEVDNFTKLGFIQGDGQLTDLLNPNKLGLSINIGDNDDDIWELFGYKKEGRKYYTTDFTKDLYEHGFKLVTSPHRSLPSSFIFWGVKEKLSFIKGVFSANGCVIKGNRVSLKSTSSILINEIKDFLNVVNIDSYITTNKSKEVKFSNGNYICKESYDLNISSIDSIINFANKIAFVHNYKNEELKDLINKKSPKVRAVKFSSVEDVYDFNLQDGTHWGVVEGVIAHNCGEIFMQPYDACRLIAVNLFSFVNNPFTDKAEFDFNKFYEINYEAMRLSDDLIDLEIEHIDKIIEKLAKDPESSEVKNRELSLWTKIRGTAMSSRRTGLGFTALGDMLAALGLKYDSDEALQFVEKVMRNKMLSELDCTIDLAILRGKFEGNNFDLEYVTEFDIDEDRKFYQGNNKFYSFIKSEFPEQFKRMEIHERRNVSFSTVAPTGTVSLLAQTTSGIEPMFQPFYMRRKKVNPNDTDTRVDFTDQNGDTWQEFPVLHPKFKDWLIINDNLTGFTDASKEESLDKDWLKDCFESSPWYKSTANDIDWIKRVEIQSIIQKYITHSISSTINLPEDVSEEEVSKIYLESWKQGLKGVTVYRDNSRSGVLVSSKEDKKLDKFEQNDAPKRPEELKAVVHNSTSKSVAYKVIVGLFDGKPYEVFIDDSEENFNGEGVVLKKDKNRYIFKQGDLEVNISNTMTYEQEAMTRLISTSLRHGANISFICEQLNKTDGDMFSFVKSIARVLKKYIPEGTKSTVECNECGSSNTIFEEGCSKCLSCGNSACG